MVKLAKAAKSPGKPKKAAPPPPKDVDDSEEEDSEEEEDDSSEVEEVPQKKAVTPAKAAGTPGKKGATPAKAATTPAKPVITPGKKAAAAKNGKKAQKKDSDDEEEEEDDDEEEEDDDESESEEETPPAKKPTPKKPAAKAEKPSKNKAAKKEESDEEEEEDDEDDDDSDTAMDTTPAPAKVKPVKAKESSDEEEEDDDEDDDEGEEDVTVKESGKRKKEVPKQKTASEAKKPKTENAESFSLFVGNLNAEKDFDELKDAIRNFFTKKNLTVSDVRLGQTKKFGYVDFSCEEDLEKAVELSGKKILGVETKMEKARSKEHNQESKKERNLRTIFVKNLPYSTTSETLQELFEHAVDVRVPVGGDGSSRGIAYVEFNTEAEAEKALEEKQGADVDGRAIVLDFTGDKAGKTGGDQKVLVINNLSYSVTESALQEVFDKAVSCKIPQNNQGRPKGFAFVEFTSVEDCKEALKNHNNTEIEGRAVRLELKGAQQGGRGAGGSGQTKTLFVRGLSEDTTEESLREAFEGAVGSRIATDRDTGSSKGFGFVDFSTVEDAKAAKEAMEDGEIDGNKVTLDFAKPKGEGGRGGFGRGGGGGRGFGRGRGFGGGYGGGRGGGRGGGGRGGGRGFGGGYGGGRGGGGGGFRGGNRGKKIRFDD